MKINRLFEIVYLLLQKDRITASELADRFEVSTRTIYRDVDMLSSAGIPIYMNKGRGGGISLLPDFVLDKSVLTEEDKENILSSLSAFKSVDLREKNELLEKFTSIFGESYIDWIEVDFSSWSNQNDQADIFKNLKNAICKRKLVTFIYSNSKGNKEERYVEPLKLCFKGEAWYLYGYCRKRQDYRFFKLMRVKDLKITEEVIEHTTYGQVLHEENKYVEKLVHLKLHIDKQMAYRVYDEFEDYKKTEDEDFIVEIDLPDDQWTLYYISTFGPYCEVLEPKEVREKLKQQLQETLNLYK
ncbi:helix-turn-helix transcriptional regulator [Intestinibacter sp.]|uniref:helix-turn-helix transcriptional regulator n=1 Tax=Intestinibacter sp. TaxID=1965304 RepID=UPI002A7539D6|nr:YafY family protein [Intestinibacter sp.]MDY2735923.1 YafY family protein [Intestinibacter sp.]MDY4575341.1 YafY family protein [Intestinibacter sp.]